MENCEMEKEDLYQILRDPENFMISSLFLTISDDDDDIENNDAAKGLGKKSSLFHDTSALMVAGSTSSNEKRGTTSSLSSFSTFPNICSSTDVGPQPQIYLKPLCSPHNVSTNRSPSFTAISNQSSDTFSHTANSAYMFQSSLSSGNIYTAITGPPLYAKPLFFRNFLRQKKVPKHIEAEECTGVFVGQLPSSYSEDDIEALLKAIGNEQGQALQVRDVKCHNRDRTCAFIMINAGALSSLLTFSKRVLCDVNCVWVVEPAQAAQLPLFIQHMPREQLRGVPKAALVLEKLTPQLKLRSGTHNGLCGSPLMGTTAISGAGVYPAAAANARPATYFSPNGFKSLPEPNALQQGYGAGTSCCASNAVLPTAAPLANGMPAYLSPITSLSGGGTGTTNPFIDAAAAASASASGGGLSGLYPFLAIASMETVNQALIAASRSQHNLSASRVNQASLIGLQTNPQPFPSPSQRILSGGEAISGVTDNMCNGNEAATTGLPTALSLSSTLQHARCSCGQLLRLSHFNHTARCVTCKREIEPNDVAYWCFAGHIVVCFSCALKTQNADTMNNFCASSLAIGNHGVLQDTRDNTSLRSMQMDELI